MKTDYDTVWVCSGCGCRKKAVMEVNANLLLFHIKKYFNANQVEQGFS